MAPQAPYMQPPPPKSGFPGWAIALIVVVLFVIVIIGILAVLAITGVRKYVSAAKSAEAMSGVRMIALDADASYTGSSKVCDSASSPVPASIADVKGKKYMSTPADWTVDAAKNAGFACIKYEMSTPQYYQYDYKKTGPSSFMAIAKGDTNGDGVESEFTLSGHVVGTTMNVDPNVKETNPTE
jgi:type IV pilus assembly protein PilA